MVIGHNRLYCTTLSRNINTVCTITCNKNILIFRDRLVDISECEDQSVPEVSRVPLLSEQKKPPTVST